MGLPRAVASCGLELGIHGPYPGQDPTNAPIRRAVPINREDAERPWPAEGSSNPK